MKVYKLFVVTLALLAGCTPQVADWTPAESPKENKVDRVVFSYFFPYSAGDKEMKPEEKRRFLQYLRDYAPSPSAISVTIQEYGGHSEKRVKDIERELLKYGVSHDLITVDYDGLETPYPAHHKHHKHKKSSESGVELTIERFIVIPPSCSNFSRKIGDAEQAYNSSNFSCAYETNLGMMVANPRDLVRGRRTSPYDGKVIAAGVNRYENDKIKPIAEVNTTDITPTNSTTTGSAGAPSIGTGGGS